MVERAANLSNPMGNLMGRVMGRITGNMGRVMGRVMASKYKASERLQNANPCEFTRVRPLRPSNN